MGHKYSSLSDAEIDAIRSRNNKRSLVVVVVLAALICVSVAVRCIATDFDAQLKATFAIIGSALAFVGYVM
jgi:hypothetical protein